MVEVKESVRLLEKLVAAKAAMSRVDGQLELLAKQKSPPTQDIVAGLEISATRYRNAVDYFGQAFDNQPELVAQMKEFSTKHTELTGSVSTLLEHHLAVSPTMGGALNGALETVDRAIDLLLGDLER